ncbi:hypothetical protein BC834DRAFT_873215 [Gloeopeniophorella convolvens]|nr:hypothetical protein BC834DRAFT_873215 [Gloeopeniophorella convolvens]
MTRPMTDIRNYGLADRRPKQLLKMVPSVPKSVSYASVISHRSPTGLTSLPDDVLLLVTSLIGVEDILALRMTSKRFSSVTKVRWLWSNVLKHQVIDRRLPVPASIADLKALSSQELEVRAIHASRFHENWCSSRPRSRRNVEFRVREVESDENTPPKLSDVHPHPISQVLFPTGHNGELIITVEQSRVACWEVPFEGSEAFLIAERHLPDRVIDGLVVNDDPENEGKLLVLFSQSVGTPAQFELTTEVWSLDKFHGSFTTLQSHVLTRASQRRMPPVACLCGDLAVIGDPVVLWDWKRSNRLFMMGSAAAHQSPTPDSVLAARLVRDHLLVIRQNHIQLLPIPRFDEDGNPVQGPSSFGAILHVQDPAREAVIIAPEVSEEERKDWQFDPVTVLMRVTANDGHSIRKYDLFPRPVAPAEVAADEERPNDSVHGPQHLLPTASPCTLPACPSQTIAVPPSCSNLAVGRNGKGMWMETRNLTSGHTTFPARCFVGFDVTSRLVPGKESQPTRWQNELALREKGLFRSRVGPGEVHQRKYRILTSSLEDTVGRIAVGGRDGRVQILDFA